MNHNEIITIRDAKQRNQNKDHLLYQKSVVFTGKLEIFDRAQAQKKVREFGGLTPSSVSKSLD